MKKWIQRTAILMLSGSVTAIESTNQNRMTLYVEVGNWQPHSLNDEPSFDTFGAAGATPFVGLGFGFPLGGDIGMRLSFGFWSLRDLNEVENVHTLTIHPLMLDIKYGLIPDNRLSVYVLYGGGLYMGFENETSPFGDKLRQARTGWGLNFGAGSDWFVAGRFGLALTFQYLYAVFRKPLGGVDDFSGPKINASILFYLNQ